MHGALRHSDRSSLAASGDLRDIEALDSMGAALTWRVEPAFWRKTPRQNRCFMRLLRIAPIALFSILKKLGLVNENHALRSLIRKKKFPELEYK